ncbi:hypothetical protein Vretimale_5514 [Volvox reticuliferus]|uniref:Uncharacterized protein n=1 Tax=Volvox reticuliferus TaxID=1737510 RepID=A0A8J4CCE8_9CHLO|nr:hypothetical protein Vretifemale_5571 [Volvox reticuliferus]GIM00649.1 hypothetical protein Vretimale_5514 [Volvox reticuliferus]
MSESSGDTPDWLRQHTETPIKIFISSSSSDDDDDMPLVRRNLGVTSGIGGGPGPSQPAVTAAQTGQVEDLQQSSQQPTGNAGQRVPKDEASQPPLELSQQSVLPASSQKQVERSQQEAQVQPLAGEPSIAANIGEAVDAGKLPIMLPERLNRNKVLLELPSAPASGEQYHGAADLSGDSGAVGRIVVLGSGASGKGAAAAGDSDGSGLQLQVDLKGVLYNAWVLPLATTAMVLNIGPTEAKVESLFNDFIRLREAVDPYGSDEDGGDAGLAYLLDGDDENYQVAGWDGEGDDAPGQGAKVSKAPGKPRKRAADKAAGGGPEKKAKTSKKAAATKANKKDGGAGVGAKRTPAGAAKKKVPSEPGTDTKGKNSTGPKKTTEAKKAAEESPAETKKKKTAASQGLGVKAGNVTKRTSAGSKKQTTLTALAAAAKPAGESRK